MMHRTWLRAYPQSTYAKKAYLQPSVYTPYIGMQHLLKPTSPSMHMYYMDGPLALKISSKDPDQGHF